MEELDRHSNSELVNMNVMDGGYSLPDDGLVADPAGAELTKEATGISHGQARELDGAGASPGDELMARRQRAETALELFSNLEDDDSDELYLDDDTDTDEEELPKVSRKVRRRRKRTRPRSKTIAMKRLTREELRRGALLYPPVEVPRPRTRAECEVEIRPCPWVACKHHLYLDVNPETGSIKINFPDLEPWELPHTCALDVAERGGITLEEVGEIMNLTRERIRQVEVRGLFKLRAASPSPEELGADLLNEDDESVESGE